MQCYIITCGPAASRHLKPIHEKGLKKIFFFNFLFVFVFINKTNRLKSDKNNLFNKQPFLRKSDNIYFFSISILFWHTTYSHCLAHELFALVLHTHRKHSPQDLSWSTLWGNPLTYFFLSVFSFTNILLQDFKSVSDHFGTLCIKVLIPLDLLYPLHRRGRLLQRNHVCT